MFLKLPIIPSKQHHLIIFIVSSNIHNAYDEYYTGE